MKTVTILIGCYYPSSLDDMVLKEYVHKTTSVSNLFYERILFEDFLNETNLNNDIKIISAPSLGFYKKECKKSIIDFKNSNSIHYVKYSCRKLFYHYSKMTGLIKTIKKCINGYDKINFIICEAHLPYLMAVKRLKNKYSKKIQNIVLFVPDLPKDVKQVNYNSIEKILKKIYIKKSNNLMFNLPNKYVCFTKQIADIFCKKETIVSLGIINNSFSSLISCNGNKTFVYSGKIEDKNGILLMIEAFNILSNTIPDAKLIICGEGPLVPTMLETIKQNKQIIFLGFVKESENINILKKSSVLMCPRIPSPQEEYCFPSKLVNYSKFLSQIVVFDNKNYRTALKNSVIYARDVSAQSLAKAMLDALNKKVNISDRLEFLYSCKSQRIIDFCLQPTCKK